MARLLIALAGLALASGCSVSAPPAELQGLWSAGPAACAEGVGVRFNADAIVAAYQDQHEVLFARPRYEVLAGESFRVRIEYKLPRRTGAPRVAGARGVLIVSQAEDGRLAAESHALMDGRTGAARLRMRDDPATSLLALEPCGARGGRSVGLRGLTSMR